MNYRLCYGLCKAGDSCINGAPHGAGYNIGKCDLTNGGPLASWFCSNGSLEYQNPCYEAYILQQYATTSQNALPIVVLGLVQIFLSDLLSLD